MKKYLNSIKLTINDDKSNTDTNYEDFTQYYEDLTPKDNQEDNYSKILHSAINNKNNKNIALTGPYGAGKSSIIQAFKSKYKHNYSFLNISLATFKDIKTSNAEEKVDENSLEKSIMQQMFYKVDNKIIPFSRFRRIVNYKKRNLIINSILFIAFIMIATMIFRPDVIKNIIGNSFMNEIWKNGSTLIKVAGILSVSFFLIYLIHIITVLWGSILSKMRLSKFSLARTTIEIDKNDENTVFDRYLDEILYFFEATDYEIVIFEDLDRYNNINIFESLRELNILINASERIKRRIIFLYATRDDIFGQEDDIFGSRNRTKFFDFIIPVIPVINSSNSGEKMIEKFKNSPWKNEIEDSFINDITAYVDDMRILKNIFNEFVTYKKQLNNINLNSTNLLSIIVYKNIYPGDFAKLLFNKGYVYDVFDKKKLAKIDILNKLNEKIEVLENDINKINHEFLNSIDELKAAYGYALGIFNDNSIIRTDREYRKHNFPSDFFEEIKKHKNVYVNLPRRNNARVDSKDILNVFGEKEDFFERKKIIELKSEGPEEKLKIELEKVKKEKLEVHSWSLKEVIDYNEDLIFNDELKDKKLLKFLLRNGYLDEMYHQYITYFYPGSVTKNDIDFILSVRDHESLPTTFELTNTKEVLSRLHLDDFKRPEILNYKLLDYIIKNIQDHSYKYDLIIEQLINDASIEFIDEYKDVSINKTFFIKSISSKWNRFWYCLELESNFSEYKKMQYLKDIINSNDLDTILELNVDSVLYNSISNNEDFFIIMGKFNDKIKDLLVHLDVKFIRLNLPREISSSILNFLYENSLYELNIHMLGQIFNEFGLKEVQINYSNIYIENLTTLQKYVEKNINHFIEEIMLKDEGTNESESSLITLLNHENVNNENKQMLIEKLDFNIRDITEIDDVLLWEKLFNHFKVDINWDNTLKYYIEFNGVVEGLGQYLNNGKINNHLAQMPIDTDKFGLDIQSNFLKDLLRSNDIEIETLSKLLERFDFYYEENDLDNIPTEKVELLMNKGFLEFSPENVGILKEYHNLHIEFLENNLEDFITKISQYNLDVEDYHKLLFFEEFSRGDLAVLINHLFEIYEIDQTVLTPIHSIIFEYRIQVTPDAMHQIVKGEFNEELKIMLLTHQIRHFDYLDENNITELLNELGTPYSQIAESGKKPTIADNSYNRDLVKALEEAKYISSWNTDKYNEEYIRINTKKSS